MPEGFGATRTDKGRTTDGSGVSTIPFDFFALELFLCTSRSTRAAPLSLEGSHSQVKLRINDAQYKTPSLMVTLANSSVPKRKAWILAFDIIILTVN